MRPRTRRRGRPLGAIQKHACFIRHLDVAVISPRSGPDQLNGPARALMRCLLCGCMGMGQLDGLATTIVSGCRVAPVKAHGQVRTR
jgi:hypothetical protein